jgi:hypothetical protein
MSSNPNNLNRTPSEGLLRGLDWIAENLQEFAISSRFALSAPNLKDKFALLKPLSELALTIWLVRRCEIHHEISDYLARWIWEQTQEGKILTHLLLARNDFLPCCSLYAPLFQLGYRAQHLDKVIEYLSATDMAKALPLSPWSALALSYNLRLLNITSEQPRHFDNLYIESLPEPWIISGEIGYSITHEVFYLTDFGFSSISDKTVNEYLNVWLPYWAQVFHEQADYDLTGEFAMAWRCIQPKSLDTPNCLNAILLAQSNSGFVQGPEGAGSSLYQRDDSAGRREFLGRYHTTLVATMAFALELRSQLHRS